MSAIETRTRTRRTFRGLVPLALALGLAAGCGSSAETAGGAVCTYAERIPCTGPAGCAGHAECLPDLSAYGACLCDRDGAVADGGPDASPGDGG